MTVRQGFWIISIVLLLLVALWTVYWPAAQWFFIPVMSLIVLGVYDMFQRQRTILRHWKTKWDRADTDNW